jgi:hypothetical protein
MERCGIDPKYRQRLLDINLHDTQLWGELLGNHRGCKGNYMMNMPYKNLMPRFVLWAKARTNIRQVFLTTHGYGVIVNGPVWPDSDVGIIWTRDAENEGEIFAEQENEAK